MPRTSPTSRAPTASIAASWTFSGKAALDFLEVEDRGLQGVQVAETLGDRMVARGGNHLLGRRHGHRRLGRNALRHLQRARDQLLVRIEQAVDEAQALGALRRQLV